MKFTNQVWVCGEVLIDLIPINDRIQPIVGGGPANTAKALAKLDVQTQFIDGISTDEYGQLATEHLIKAGVLLDFVKYMDKPTCLATVLIDKNGSAKYNFEFDQTATFEFAHSWLPDPAIYRPALLHIGTLVAVIEPASSVLFTWATKVSKYAPIVFDPNIRPEANRDRKKYLDNVERWVSISTVIKASDDDISWLYPGVEIEVVANNWLDIGPELIVVTLGKKGIMSFRKNEIIRADAIEVAVIDTVAAGDTVGAVLVEGILKYGLSELSKKQLELILERASKAASITVSRSGAQPPNKHEIEKFLI
jgi:fructokinase